MDYTAVIAKLLAEAEREDTTDAQRDKIMTKIQQLSTTHQVELHTARMHMVGQAKREEPTVKTVTVGTRGQRGLRAHIELMLAITGPNDIQCTMAHNATYINLCGFPTDIETVESLYNFLLVQMVESANVAIKRGDHKHERDWNTRSGHVDARVFRAAFYKAFTYRISIRLYNARQAAIAEMEKENARLTARMSGVEFDTALRQADPTGATTSAQDFLASETNETGMVLKDKALKVKEHFDSGIGGKAKGTWKGAKSTGYSASGSKSGATAGDKARIRPQAELAGRKQLAANGR